MKKFMTTLIALLLVLGTVFVPVSAAEAAPKYTGRDDFLWGVNMHNSNWFGYPKEKLEDQVHLAAEMGVKLIRINLDMADIEYTDKVVELCHAYGIKIMGTFPLRNDDPEYITYNYKFFANRYNGKDGRGYIDYYQLDNEMDLYLLEEGDADFENGTGVDEYDPVVLAEVAEKFKAAIAGVKAGSDAKTVINFSWLHYGFLTYMVKNGVDFDIIGLDWYDDGGSMLEPDKNQNKCPEGILNALKNNFPDKKIIICESNCLQSDKNKFDNSNIAHWNTLLKLMEQAYSFDQCIGFTVYELLDETGHTGDDAVRESTLGLIETDEYGNIREPKAIYNQIKEDIGGKTLTKITEEELDLSVYPNIGVDGKPDPLKDADGVVARLENSDVKTTWGDKFIWSGDRVRNYGLNPVDFSMAKYIEFDIFIEDYELLKKAMADNKINIIYFALGSNPENTSDNWGADFYPQITKSGWNHIKIKKSNFKHVGDGHVDWSKVSSFKCFFDPPSDNLNPVVNHKVAVANVCGTGIKAPAPLTEADGVVAELKGASVAQTWGDSFHFSGDRVFVSKLNPVDFSQAKYIEFDIFIQDYDALKQAMTANGITKIFFTLGSNPENTSQNKGYDFYSQIKKSGWNHITIPKEKFIGVGDGEVDWTKVSSFKCFFDPFKAIANPVATHDVVIANVCGTIISKPAPLTEADGVVEGLELQGEYKQTVWGDTFGAANPNIVTAVVEGSSFDFSKAEYIEFDMFIEDYDALKKAMAENDVHEIYFGLCSVGAGGAAWNLSAFTVQLTKSGWNHIRLPKNSFGDFIGTTEWSTVIGFTCIFLENGDNANPVANHKVAVANVCATVAKKGDVNGDHKINILDLVRLKKVLAKMDVPYDEIGANVDGIDKIDARDMAQLRKMLLGA